MNCSRRDLALLLPGLLAAAQAADAAHPNHKDTVLPSKCYPFDSLHERTNPKTHNQTRQVLDGLTHDRFHIDLHITTLEPGEMPHPPHSHVWEEMTLVQKGTLEATISGRTTRVGPGGVIYVASENRHGWKNVGDTQAQYFVLAFRGVEPA